MAVPKAYGDLLSVAPMMEITDRHFRYFWRLLSKRSVLWTEMVVDSALLFSDKTDGFLRFNEEEHPIVCQLGGSEPATLARAAAMVKAAGYDGINLNCGCPSPRVAGRGLFGAALMFEPELVRDCVAAMREATGDSIPISIKCRLGADGMDSYEAFARFIAIVSSGGAQHFVVHARKCLLRGLSPKDNRTVPPLRYHWVQRAALEFPHLRIGINGGVATLTDAATLLLLQRSVPRPLPLTPGATGTEASAAAAAAMAQAIAAVAARAAGVPAASASASVGAAALGAPVLADASGETCSSPARSGAGAGASPLLPLPAIPLAAALLSTAALPPGVRADPRRTMSKAALRLQRRKEDAEDATTTSMSTSTSATGPGGAVAAGSASSSAADGGSAASMAEDDRDGGSDRGSDSDSEGECDADGSGAAAVGCGCELPNPPDDASDDGSAAAPAGAAAAPAAAAGPHARPPAVGGKAALIASGKAGADGLGPDGYPVDPMLQVAPGVERIDVAWLPDRSAPPATVAKSASSGAADAASAGAKAERRASAGADAADSSAAAEGTDAAAAAAAAAAAKAAAIAATQAEQLYRYTFASHPAAAAATAAATAAAGAGAVAAASGGAGLASAASDAASDFRGLVPLLAADPSRNLLESVMIGRAASNTPWMFADVDRVIYGVPNPGHSRREVIELYLRYCEELIPARTPSTEREGSHRMSYVPATLMKPLLNLFAGCFGGSRYRGALAGNVTAKRMPLREAVAAALADARISDAVLDERPPAGP